VQTDINALGPAGPLRGTLLAPASTDVPVILIVPGSGATDRNGDSPGLRTSTYKQLAEGLSAGGIATVRIDKRGMYGSVLAIADANAVTIRDYATDVHSWVAAIRKRTGVACVWVLGHSEGGLVALVAGESPSDICGLILMATPGRPLGEVIRKQLQSSGADARVLSNALATLDVLDAGQQVDETRIDPAWMPLFRPQVQGLLMSELALDPATLIAAFEKPVLIMQGQRDTQVRLRDAKQLKRADPQAELVLLPDTNHFFKSASAGGGSENVPSTNSDFPLENHVIDDIYNFVKSAPTNR